MIAARQMGADFLIVTRCDGISPHGTKQPIFAECQNSERYASNRLVKVARAGMINEHHLAVEAVCAKLVSGLGLNVADHQVAVLQEPYLASINSTLKALNADFRLSPGFGVGATVCEGIQPIARGMTYSEAHRADASVLYAFDLMCTHYDRLPDNPNCGVRNGRLFVYDFDQCFPDVSEPSQLYQNRRPWEVHSVDWRDLHLFRAWLKNRGIKRDAIQHAFARWTFDWWRENKPDLPRQWLSIADNIWERAIATAENLDRFIEEVELSLI